MGAKIQQNDNFDKQDISEKYKENSMRNTLLGKCSSSNQSRKPQHKYLAKRRTIRTSTKDEL